MLVRMDERLAALAGIGTPTPGVEALSGPSTRLREIGDSHYEPAYRKTLEEQAEDATLEQLKTIETDLIADVEKTADREAGQVRVDARDALSLDVAATGADLAKR